MADLSHLSDEELDALHQQALAQAPASSAGAGADAPDLSSLSDEELDRLHQTALQQQARAPQKPGMAESAMRGIAQGPFGLADEAYGLVGAVVNPTNSDKGFADRYRDARDYARRKDAEAKAANPKTFTAGMVGGGLATAFLPGASFLNAGKGATVAGAAGKGALSGGLTGLGNSEADITKGELPKAAADTAKGAALGYALGGTIQSAANGLNAPLLRAAAERRAEKAAGVEGVAGAGRELLDNNVVQFGDRAKNIADKADKARSAAGKDIGETLGGVDQEMASRFLHSGGDETAGMVEGAAIAKQLRTEAEKISGEGNQALVKRLNEVADRYEEMGQFPLSKAAKEKKSFPYAKGDVLTESKEARNLVKRAIGDEMEAAVGRFEQSTNREAAAAEPVAQEAATLKTGTGSTVTAPPHDPVAGAVAQVGQDLTAEEQAALSDAIHTELGQDAGAATPAAAASKARELLDRYKKAKKTYGVMAEAGKTAGKLADRQARNRTFSLTDYLAGLGVGGPTLSPLKGLAAASANKALRERGSSSAAVAADTVAKLLERTPEAFGKYAPMLQKAAQSGQLPMVHYILMRTNPGYAAQVQNLNP